MSLAGVEDEITGYRLGRWVPVELVAPGILSVNLNRANYGAQSRAFALRAGSISAV